VEYLQESADTIYHRRRRWRAVITLTFVSSMLVATVLYAASYVQGWVGANDPRPVVAAACSKPASNRPVTPGRVTINIYNTTARAGLAALVADGMRKQGFKVAAVDNDPLGMWIEGVGEIRHGQTGEAGAILAGARLPGARIVEDDRTDATVDLVLGNKFTALTAPPNGVGQSVVLPRPAC
jgi:LytR cell envelope-related transcriptional attenuator